MRRKDFKFATALAGSKLEAYADQITDFAHVRIYF